MADLISSVIDNKANEQVITLTKQLDVGANRNRVTVMFLQNMQIQ